MTKTKPKNFISVGWDYKAPPDEVLTETIEAINNLLKQKASDKIYRYDDPLYYGSDMYGYLLSTEPLTEQDIDDYEIETIGEE